MTCLALLQSMNSDSEDMMMPFSPVDFRPMSPMLEFHLNFTSDNPREWPMERPDAHWIHKYTTEFLPTVYHTPWSVTAKLAYDTCCSMNLDAIDRQRVEATLTRILSVVTPDCELYSLCAAASIYMSVAEIKRVQSTQVVNQFICCCRPPPNSPRFTPQDVAHHSMVDVKEMMDYVLYLEKTDSEQLKRSTGVFITI